MELVVGLIEVLKIEWSTSVGSLRFDCYDYFVGFGALTPLRGPKQY